MWFVPMPATTVQRSPTAEMTARRISPSSATEVVGASPVVPLTTMPSLPWSARWVATLATPSRSTLPSAVNGVTIAVSTRPNGAAGRLMPYRLSIVGSSAGEAVGRAVGIYSFA